MEFRPLYHAISFEQAHMLRNLLAQCGIVAMVDGSSVLVADDHVEAALPLVADFQQRQRLRRDAEHEDDDDPWHDEADLPFCPVCSLARMVRCQVCGTVGRNFPMADANYWDSAADAPAAGEADWEPADSAALTEVALICPTCDEPFRPEYVRTCEQCGHDFGSGYELESDENLHPSTHPLRTALWVAALAVLIVGLFLWLALSWSG